MQVAHRLDFQSCFHDGSKILTETALLSVSQRCLHASCNSSFFSSSFEKECWLQLQHGIIHAGSIALVRKGKMCCIIYVNVMYLKSFRL
ncbi:hypothetical protein PAHAL_4G015700 [Panicum hallii]|uniref:Uncharacterized protein n=1 Tax=Panicum hallii TaxID=206008 RepID=A0A2S3HGM4_9POAL|nr:hypothetical protein PAHAL_4G015700 [Panicum hallii]